MGQKGNEVGFLVVFLVVDMQAAVEVYGYTNQCGYLTDKKH